MNNENLNINKLEEEEGGFDFKIILMKLIIYWKWFVVSIVLCLLCAFVYLRYATPVYRIQATVMINDEKKGSFQNQMMAMQDFGFVGTTGGVDNEIEILRSKSMIKQAIVDMGMFVQYQLGGRIAKRVIYGNYPIEVQISDDDLANLTRSFLLEISHPDSTKYKIEYAYKDLSGEMVEFEKTISGFPYVLGSYGSGADIVCIYRTSD